MKTSSGNFEGKQRLKTDIISMKKSKNKKITVTPAIADRSEAFLHRAAEEDEVSSLAVHFSFSHFLDNNFPFFQFSIFSFFHFPFIFSFVSFVRFIIYSFIHFFIFLTFHFFHFLHFHFSFVEFYNFFVFSVLFFFIFHCFSFLLLPKHLSPKHLVPL